MHELITGYGALLAYFVLCVAGAFVLRRFVAVPREMFRKTLHIIVIGSIFILTYVIETWWVSVIASIVFVAMVFPILMFAERMPGYSELLIERKKGEIKKSLVVVFTMFSVLIFVLWGLLGEKYLVIASVFAWGFGDAAAALVGKRFGRHHIEGRLVEGRKSLEGTLAMAVVSFVSVLIVFYINGSLEWQIYIPISAVTAVVCAVVELYTKNGMDTLTCPLSAALTMILLLHLWGV